MSRKRESGAPIRREMERRIAEMEAELRALREEVHRLRAAGDVADREAAAPSDESESRVWEQARAQLMADVKRNVGRALSVNGEESLEDRIMGAYLPRLAVVLMMVAVALGAGMAFGAEYLSPAAKTAIGYALSAIGIGYGIVWRKREDLFSPVILGCGLAGVYFTTYAAFFVENMRVIQHPQFAPPLLFMALLALLGVAHWRKSQVVAGMGMFLIYTTVIVSLSSSKNAELIVSAFITCAAICVAALVFQALHRWMTFTWTAFVATYITYLFYFHAKPVEFDITARQYFWLSNSFLGLLYALCSLACVLDARRRGEYRRGVASLAGVNSAIFFTLTWFSIREHYLEQEWMFRAGFAAFLALLAVFAETTGPRRNYLFQIFVAKTVIMLTLALQSLLSGELLLLAMSVECLGLSFSYRRSGIVMFKALNALLMLVTFVGCLFAVRMGGEIGALGYSVPRNWFCCGGVAFFFCIVAWHYEKFVRRPRPEERTVSGQWFMADSRLDFTPGGVALAHTAAAAIILLAVTILDLGESPYLPHILAGEAALMALLGLILRTHQVDVASVLLLVAAHVSYYFFLWIDKPGFEEQPGHIPMTIAVAVMTYIGAFLFERYLGRFSGGRPWEHHVTAAAPYFVATLLLTTLIERSLIWMYGPLMQNTLGVILLVAGYLLRYPGVMASGALAFFVGSASFFARLYAVDQTLTSNRGPFLFYLALLLITYAAGERLIAAMERSDRQPQAWEDGLRTILVSLAATLAVLALYLAVKPWQVTMAWTLHGLIAILLGAAFRESRYRWAALGIFGLSVGRFFFHDLFRLPEGYRFLSVAVLAVALLLVGWFYHQYRMRRGKAIPPASAGKARPHGG